MPVYIIRGLKKYIPIFMVFLSTIVIGCVSTPTQPTQQQIFRADYGHYPDNYKEIVMNYYKRTLFDPYSAHYRWIKEPYEGWLSHYSSVEFGYIIHVGINAKNRMGGYTGEQQNLLLIKNGEVILCAPPSIPE